MPARIASHDGRRRTHIVGTPSRRSHVLTRAVPDPSPMVTKTECTVFVSTKLVSPNVREHWGTRGKRVKAQRNAVTTAFFWAFAHPSRMGMIWSSESKHSPKTVHFLAHVARRMDDDNLAGACKAVRDGLMDARLIDDDGDPKHKFEYAQVIDGREGVTITVRRLDASDGP